MKKPLLGLILGVMAGIIDVIPMILQKLTIDADISAFVFWVVSGFLIATSNLKIFSVFKGIIISFLVLIPALILIAWKEPMTLIPICIMTLILSSLLGFFIEKFGS